MMAIFFLKCDRFLGRKLPNHRASSKNVLFFIRFQFFFRILFRKFGIGSTRIRLVSHLRPSGIKEGRAYFYHCIAALLLLNLSYCSPSISPTDSNRPFAIDGEIDLGNYDLNLRDPILLAGLWKFHWLYWKGVGEETPTEALSVPSSWNGKNGTRIGEGYGTYELTVKLNRNYKELALLVPEQSSAYTLMIDGRTIVECGSVEFLSLQDKTSFQVKPAWCNRFVRFVPNGDQFHIDMLVANKDHRLGGFWSPIRLGESESLHKAWENERYLDIFLAGGLFCVGMLHLIFAVFRKGEPASLYFGIFCIVMATRGIFAGTRIAAEYLPFLGFEHFIRIEYITFYLAIPVFLSYILSIFPREFKRVFVDIVWWIAIIATIIVLALPVRIFTFTITIYYLVAFLAGALGLYSLTKAAVRRKQGAITILGGFIFIYAAMIHDLFYATFFLDTGYFAHIGAFAFLLAQSIFLSIRSSENLDRLIDLSRNLEKRVEERTKQLRNALRLIRNDLTVAREIQKDLLNLKDNERITISDLTFEVLHKPLAEVGGDLYDILELPDGSVRIFAADATGHGVQAALLTILIRRAYEDHRLKEDRPGKLMSALSAEFHETYKNVGTYFSASILEVSNDRRTLRYSLAGAPPVIVQTDGGEQLLECENPLVGLLKDFVYTEREIELPHGFRILCFTDGLTEASREMGDYFGSERVLGFLRQGRDTELNILIPMVYSELLKFLGLGGPKDDVLLIGFERKGRLH
ncbi:SpoIIE-like protein phosphatase domain protein [Leptospira fainei serovar Hurstbridge str. BUT 6]|uniref:SpoIIE-like protein phosphatase domain protein n=1 Tax=Leptospira fainei serovar Hurstbridge str. BUT 6 TaxID=1193011 RepID=S3UZN6_9LEPT|nr:SpoIIE-like protein phosphatase domain protein [Leptospira fainei serovar Hurstbridge str. BUT 6]